MRWLFRLIGIVVLLAVVLVAGLLMLPGDKIAKVALDQIEAQTGRAVTLKGETRLSYYPVLGARTGALEIANADWSHTGPLLTAEGLKVGVDLTALLAGDIKITGLELLSPAVLLERHSDGRANWEIGVDGIAPSGQAFTGSSNALALSLDRALIAGGSLRYLDHGTGTDLLVEDLALDLSWPVYRGKAGFALSARPAGMEEIAVQGEVADLAALIEGQVTKVTATASLPETVAQFSGLVGLPSQLQANVSFSTTNSAVAFAALGIPDVQLPQGLGQVAQVSGNVTVTDGTQLSLREASLRLDQNSFTWAADLDLSGPRPNLTARFSGGALDFSQLGGGETTAGEGSVLQDGWSKAPIDASALALLNEQVSLTAPSLKLPGLNFDRLELRADLDRSRLVVALKELSGYGGGFAGQVVANNRSGLSVGGDVRATGVDMQSLLGDLIGVTRFTGQADAHVAYLGVGQSLHQIMHSLSGDGALNMGRGTIEGIDLDSLMRQGLVTGGTTVFDSLTATFTMQNGDLNNPDLLLQLPVVNATGMGRVGLGNMDIDYLFTPQIGSLENQGGLAIPVRIKGPWAAPKVWPDLEKAIDLNLKEEKAKAKAELENKVSKELGLDQQDGESLEDAAKRKLEEEVLKGLGNLFKN
ncbi:AsmA family protein [Thalassobius sp. MITS945101]|uniref:AsmA family protein n=1 Tax=Thalassobius sp. MITS945101 TaxID=3096994 RepID=UPI00399C04DA